MRIKLTTPGWENFNGPLAGLTFDRSIAVSDTMPFRFERWAPLSGITYEILPDEEPETPEPAKKRRR